MYNSGSVTVVVLLATIVGVHADEPLPVGTPDAVPDQSAASAETAAAQHSVNDSEGISLLKAPIREHWTHFASQEDVSLGDVWSLGKQGDTAVLTCVGSPKGFLLTKKKFRNFVMTFEWRYTEDENGNSGILVFTQNEPRLWPTSLQVQLHQPRAGAVFPSGDAKSDNTTEVPEDSLALGVGEWNKCRIVAENGRLSVQINGHEAGGVSGCDPQSGHIAIQSEGSVTQFRNIVVREIATEAADRSEGSIVNPPAADASAASDTAGNS